MMQGTPPFYPNQTTESNSPRPITDEELRGAVVMECSLLELREHIEDLRQERAGLTKLSETLIPILKGFVDLYEELAGKTVERSFLDRAIRKAEREAARLRLPLWFWRPEPGVELKVQLYRRARFLLFEMRALNDDIFDLLREFVDDWARPEEHPVSDDQLAGVIEYAARKGAN
jgi:hypothetical protein